MSNLLNETISIMKENNKEPEDVKFIRCEWYDWGGATLRI